MFLRKKKVYRLKDFKNREVNLLPRDLYKISKKRIIAMATTAILMIFVSLFIGFELTMIKTTEDMRSEIDFKSIEIASDQSVIQNQTIIKSLDSRISQRELLINFIDSKNRSILVAIEAFEELTINEVYLTSLSANSENSFVISATATSNESISYLINQLKLMTQSDGSPYFTKVFTNGIVRNENDEGNVLYLFQIQCEFEGGLDEAQ